MASTGARIVSSNCVRFYVIFKVKMTNLEENGNATGEHRNEVD